MNQSVVIGDVKSRNDVILVAIKWIGSEKSRQGCDSRGCGADDRQIHDTVLIAAAFCMFNRYVDGFATGAPTDPDVYRARAVNVIKNGYSAVKGYE